MALKHRCPGKMVDNRFLFECFLQASKNFLFFLVSCFVLFLLFGAEFQAKSTA